MAVHFLTFIALFLCLYLAVLYQSLAACAVFLFLGIYLILAFCQLFYLSRNLQFEIVRASASKSEEREISFALSVKNTGALPLSHGCICLTVCDLQKKPCQTQKLTFSVRGKGETQLCGTLEGQYCGRFYLSVKFLRIYSPGSLLSWRKSLSCKTELLFYPKITPFPVTISEGVRYFVGEHEEEEIVPGHFHTPAGEIREFRPGDRLRQIHWKLSAGNDCLLVRDLGMPESFPVVLFLANQPLPRENFTASYSRFLETAMSLSASLLLSGCRHFVVWYHHREEKLIRFPMRTETDLDFCTYALLQEEAEGFTGNFYTLYAQQYPLDTFCTTLFLNTKLEFYKNKKPESLQALPPI